MNQSKRGVVTLWVVVFAVAAAFNSGRFFAWLALQTPTVQAAIYAPAIALIGVIANTWVSGWNTGRQLEHDRIKSAQEHEHDRQTRAEDRRLELRRDIYLGLAEYILDCINTISSWADTGLAPRDIIASWRKASRYSAQTNLMAGVDLAKAIATFNLEFDKAVVRVRTYRDKVVVDENRLATMRQKIAEHRSAAKAALDALRAKGREGSLSEGDSARLIRIAEQEEAHAAPIAFSHDQLFATIPERKWEVLSVALEERRKVARLVLPIVAAARAELGETINMNVYADILAEAETRKIASEIRPLFGLGPKDAG